jgi:uncharacterized membrane protein
MDILNQILLWLHLTALALGGVASFGIPVVGSKMPTATAETRPMLFSVMKGLSRVAQVVLGLLLITGPILFWLKWSFTAPSMTWFGIKMLLVVILIGGVIFSGVNGRRIEAGNREAAALQPRVGMAMMLVLLGVILTAVFAFE